MYQQLLCVPCGLCWRRGNHASHGDWDGTMGCAVGKPVLHVPCVSPIAHLRFPRHRPNLARCDCVYTKPTERASHGYMDGPACGLRSREACVAWVICAAYVPSIAHVIPAAHVQASDLLLLSGAACLAWPLLCCAGLCRLWRRLSLHGQAILF